MNLRVLPGNLARWLHADLSGPGQCFDSAFRDRGALTRPHNVRDHAVAVTENEVLVVESNELLRWSIAKYLGPEFSVAIATDTNEAVTMFQQSAFGAVIIGCPQSPMTCNELCTWAKERFPEVRVVALPEMPDDFSLCCDQHGQFDAVLCKPVDLAALKEVVVSLT